MEQEKKPDFRGTFVTASNIVDGVEFSVEFDFDKKELKKIEEETIGEVNGEDYVF